MFAYTDDDLLTLELQIKRGDAPLRAEMLRLINMCRDLLAEAESDAWDRRKDYETGFEDGYAAAERGE